MGAWRSCWKGGSRLSRRLAGFLMVVVVMMVVVMMVMVTMMKTMDADFSPPHDGNFSMYSVHQVPNNAWQDGLPGEGVG